MKIGALSLYSSDLDLQTSFYEDILGFPKIAAHDNFAQFQIGQTLLTLLKKESFTPYHFAINIPSNKAPEAYQWLQRKVKLLKDGNDDFIDFKSWNARAMYFYDADRNIVEFIARKNLSVNSSEEFTAREVLGISEIGMPVSDIESAYHQLCEFKEMPIYDGNFDRFCAAGDETGLLIIIDKSKKKWYPTNDPAASSDFFLEGDFNFAFINGQIQELP